MPNFTVRWKSKTPEGQHTAEQSVTLPERPLVGDYLRIPDQHPNLLRVSRVVWDTYKAPQTHVLHCTLCDHEGAPLI